MKLRQILQTAVDDELISKNPCRSVPTPRPVRGERKALSLEEASRLRSCLLREPMGAQVACVLLMLDCGMRKGEALGLTWEAFDEQAGTLSITQQYTGDKRLRAPKSRSSTRTVCLTRTARDFLVRWRGVQAAELGNLAIRQGGETPIVHSVSVSREGGAKLPAVNHMDDRNFSRWFRDFAVDHGFGTYRTITKTFVRDGVAHVRGKDYVGLCPHALRHTQATLLISEGADVKTVQSRLGHSSPDVTLSIYSHVVASKDREAADEFESLLSKVGKSNSQQ